MAGAHEHAEHAQHMGHVAEFNKKVALLIAVLSLGLALAETLGKGAQTAALAHNIEATNLWTFFQAKGARLTEARTAMEALAVKAAGIGDGPARAEALNQIETWRQAAARYEDEPSTGEGRRQLALRAQAAERLHATAFARYHRYEGASAALQIGIVLASAAVITGAIALAWIAGALGGIALCLMAIGLFIPEAIHFF